MRAGEAFFDSSVILYLLSGNEAQADAVEELLLREGHISVQVLNEVVAIALRKQALSIAEIREFLSGIRECCRTHALTPDTHDRGLAIAERYKFSIYDSMIVAAALECGARTLYSEDLQHGQVIEGQLKVVNPFVAA